MKKHRRIIHHGKVNFSILLVIAFPVDEEVVVKMRKKALTIVFVLLGIVLFGEVLFDNFNIYAVKCFPYETLTVQLEQKSKITKITHYHWNYSQGAYPGQIALIDQSGKMYGPWQAYGEPGQGGVPNAYWVMEPDIILDAGNYSVFDSDPSSWSWNAQSQGMGMSRIEGEKQGSSQLKAAFFGQGIGGNKEDKTESVSKPEKKTAIVQPSSQPQTLSFENGVKITIPGGTLKNSTELVIEDADYEKTVIDKDFDFVKLASYEITLGSHNDFPDQLTIEVPYDEKRLNPDYTPGQQIIARRWDEENDRWVYLPSKIDTHRNVIITKTDHLTLFEWIFLAHFATSVHLSHSIHEYIFFDALITDHFYILYESNKINKNKAINDAAWIKKGGNVIAGRVTANYPNMEGIPTAVSGETIRLEPLSESQLIQVPIYIMDLGYLLDQAYKKYSEKFEKPPTPIIVKVDSNYVKLTGARGAYEKIYKRIHINTSLVSTVDMLKFASAHELFHVFQNVHYSKLEMSQVTGRAYQWWLESSADWAACNIAWPNLKMMGAKASGIDPYPKGLEYPLDYLGSPDCLIEDLEYDRAYLIDHFVREGADFVSLYKYLVDNKEMNEPVFDPLRDYFMYNQTYNSDNFDELYRDYAAFFCLSSKSPISSHDLYDKIANKKDVYQQSRTKKIEADFDLEGGYSSKVWAVKIQGTKKEKLKINKVSSSSKMVSAEVFILKGGKKSDEYYDLKAGEINAFFESVEVEVSPGDLLIAIVSNTDSKKQQTMKLELQTGEVDITTDPEKIDEKSGKLEHDIEILVDTIPTRYERVKLVWYDNHEPGKKKQEELTVTNNRVEITINQSFPGTGDHTLIIQVQDPGDDTKILGEKEVSVKIESMGTGSDCGVNLSKLKKVVDARKIYYVDSNWDMQGPYETFYDKERTKKKEKGCQKDDYPVGRWNTWHENGNKLSEGSYNDNHERDGLWEFWYEDGIPHSSINYLEGIPHGSGVWYYANGRKEMQGKLDEGEKTGKWQEWYENGKKKFEGVYKKGKLHGPFKSYYETGKLSQTGNYTNGEPSGVWNYYRDNGIRYKTLDYNNAVTIWYEKDGEEVDRVDNW